MMETRRFIENRLKSAYESLLINNDICFVVSSTSIVKIGNFDDCIVAEYADSMEDAYNNVFEDGDAFSTKVYSDEEILERILDEIE